MYKDSTPEQKAKAAAYMREYLKANADRINARRRDLQKVRGHAYYEATRESRKRYKSKYYASAHGKAMRRGENSRKFSRKRGGLPIDAIVTNEQIAEMAAQQQGACAICHGEFGLKKICVDHDHRTGRVRGLLCNACNLHLGWMERNLPTALTYTGYA